MSAMAKAIDLTCNAPDCPGVACETHWRIDRRNDEAWIWAVCPDHVEVSRLLDESPDIVRTFHLLYLPIVQPVVGSEQAIAMEVALHAACRLLRTQADTTQAERDEAEQTLALLRQAQAEAWDRVHGRAA